MIDTTTLTTPIPTETVTPLRPSEALRLGRLTRPLEIKGNLYDGKHGACALGAMREGFGLPETATPWGADADYAAIGLPAFLPPCDCIRSGNWWDSGTDAVWHMNDQHDWNTDQIASWLEGLGL